MYNYLIMESLADFLKDANYSLEDLIDIIASQEKQSSDEEPTNIYIPNENSFFEIYNELLFFSIKKGTNKVLSFIKLLQVINNLYISIDNNSIYKAEKFRHLEIFKLANHLKTKLKLQEAGKKTPPNKNLSKLSYFYLLSYNILIKLVDFRNCSISIDVELSKVMDDLLQKASEIISQVENTKNTEDSFYHKWLKTYLEKLQDLDLKTRQIYRKLKFLNFKESDEIQVILQEFKNNVKQTKKEISNLRKKLLESMKQNEIEIFFNISNFIESFRTTNFTRYINKYLSTKDKNYITAARKEVARFGIPLANLIKKIEKFYNKNLNVTGNLFLITPIMVNSYILLKKDSKLNQTAFIKSLKNLIILDDNIISLIFVIKPILFFLFNSLKNNSEDLKILNKLKLFIKSNKLNLIEEIKLAQSIKGPPLNTIIKKLLGNEAEILIKNHHKSLITLQTRLFNSD